MTTSSVAPPYVAASRPTPDSPRAKATIDANEAVARVAFRTNEVVAIYPITPASPMGEWSDQYASEARPNIWGTVPEVIEMQSEGGAAGAVHGSLQAGALTTTFTASQGLLLMIPNMYKIAGELTSAVIHVAARSLATSSLSIFCDHSDVMAARGTGFAILCSNSVQEAADFALISQAATLESRIPFMHFFDGFRTSHEVAKITELTDDDLRAMVSDELVRAHRSRALSPDNPFIRGTAMNPDVYFQARESVNPFYLATPTIVQNAMDAFGEITGRRYQLYEYVGAPDAERVIVMMGSGAETTEETVEHLVDRGEKVGLLKVRLFRPFDATALLAALPNSVRAIAILDRTKEPGAAGEPLYQDVLTAAAEALANDALPFDGGMPRIVGGRYGLSSKEYTPAMAAAIYQELGTAKPRNHFTVGIIDDVNHTHLDYDPSFSTEDDDIVRCVFFGLGSDGTVGANKNSIKIIGTETDNYAQGYFVYDSKKSGSMTTSHLRFGPRPIRSAYLITEANFVACHQETLMNRVDVLGCAMPGATFLLNTFHSPAKVWETLAPKVRRQIAEKKLKVFVIDAHRVAMEAGLPGRINTVMQTCFFAISGVLPRDAAIESIKGAIRKTFGKRGPAIVQKNIAAVDAALDHLHEIEITDAMVADATKDNTKAETAGAAATRILGDAPDFLRDVTARLMAGEGDLLPVSAIPADGTYPCATTQFEKRNIAHDIPVWDPDVCIQCGKCVMVCPHAVIRGKMYDPAMLEGAPDTFKSTGAKWPQHKDLAYTLQVAPDDCTGCRLCVEVCPAKNKSEAGRKAINMEAQAPLRAAETDNWDFFQSLPFHDRKDIDSRRVKDVQLLEPLFEFSGACAGCGETPYLKLMSQLFGDRSVIANATGCSSIYGGNLPTTPWAKNAEGRGPAWSNSLFEDNAEFGLGMRLSIDKQRAYAQELLKRLAPKVGEDLATAILTAPETNEAEIEAQRARVAFLKTKLGELLSGSALNGSTPAARDLLAMADMLVRRNVWIVGGDGWAYDIGYGGLDHVMASGRDVNILVLDTEVYSNTGGQASKATPRAAVAKFAAGGKPSPKKDLALLAMTYGNVYVARVAMGANDAQTVKAFLEAESYRGPSIIIAYSHCIAHGFDLAKGMEQQKLAVQSGYWPTMRFDPRRQEDGENPLQLDARPPSKPIADFAYNETRFSMLLRSKPEQAKALMAAGQEDVRFHWKLYEFLAAMHGEKAAATAAAQAAAKDA